MGVSVGVGGGMYLAPTYLPTYVRLGGGGGFKVQYVGMYGMYDYDGDGDGDGGA